jgi:ribosomal protein L40E
MKSHEISVDDRDAFVAHAVNFDHDDNGYLKKAELEDAAKAWTADSTEEAAEEVASSEETGESSEKVCPVCSSNNPADAITCASCGWTFES